MKEALIKSAIYTIMPVVVFLPLIFYITYIEFESIIVSSVVSFVLFLLWYFFSMHWKGRKRRKYVSALLKLRFPLSEDKPLLSYGEGWEQGFGFTDEEVQPMWAKANEEGIVVFYLCVAQKNPFILPWERISQVRVFEFLIDQKKRAFLAKLSIPGVGMNIMVPWNHRFNQFAPENKIKTESGVGRINW